MRIAPQRAKTDSAQTHHGANRKINAARDDHRCQCKRQQSNLNSKPDALEKIGPGEEVLPGHAEQGNLECDQGCEDQLLLIVFHGVLSCCQQALLTVVRQRIHQNSD